MSAQWHYLIDGEQVGPVSTQELQDLALDGIVQPTDLVWTQGMEDWKPAFEIPGLIVTPPPVAGYAGRSSYPAFGEDRDYQQFVGNKIAAGLCGILLGPLGVHKFILGLTTPGVIMLLISLLTCGLGTILTGPLGLIEGIVYLTKSDEEFYERYAVQKREWF